MFWRKGGCLCTFAISASGLSNCVPRKQCVSKQLCVWSCGCDNTFIYFSAQWLLQEINCISTDWCIVLHYTIVHVGGTIHSKNKTSSKHLSWCFSLSQIVDLCQYLERPISTWKDHNRDIWVQKDKRYSYCGLYRY